jgi:excisionase family DNA binding protein
MRFLTKAEVARTLSVSNITVHRLIIKGEIQSLKVGSAVRIPEESLKEYVDRNLKGNGKEYPKKKRYSLRGITSGSTFTDSDIDEARKAWQKQT